MIKVQKTRCLVNWLLCSKHQSLCFLIRPNELYDVCARKLLCSGSLDEQRYFEAAWNYIVKEIYLHVWNHINQLPRLTLLHMGHLPNRDLSPKYLFSTFHSRKADLGDIFMVKQGPAALESILFQHQRW